MEPDCSGPRGVSLHIGRYFEHRFWHSLLLSNPTEDVRVEALLAHSYKTASSITVGLKILIAEDEAAISMQYSVVLGERGHEVTSTEDGIACLSEYVAALGRIPSNEHSIGRYDTKPPFDLVVLDYRMPRMDGLETAKRIFDLCPSQRVMFASAYTAQTLMDAVKHLHKVVELLQKPFDLEYFVDSVEDKALYEQLERLNVRVRALKDHNVSHSELLCLLEGVRKLRELALSD